jgi:hypothetical protein
MLGITSRMQPCAQLPQQDGPQQGNPINTILLQTMRRLQRGALVHLLARIKSADVVAVDAPRGQGEDLPPAAGRHELAATELVVI